MSFLKRALLSVKKHKVKNIILLLILCAVGIVLFSAILINRAVQKVENGSASDMNAQVIVGFDPAKAQSIAKTKYETYYHYLPITNTLLDRLKSVQHVKDYNYISCMTCIADNFDLGLSGPVQMDEKGNPVDKDQLRECSVICASDTAKLTQFSSYTYRLTGGRQITKADDGKHVVLISDILAEHANLHVGSKITLRGYYDRTKTQEFSVVGVFATAENQIISGLYIQSLLFADHSSVFELNNDPSGNYQTNLFDQAIYYLDNPSSVDYFEAQASKIPDMFQFKFSTNKDVTEKFTGSIKTVGLLSSMMTKIMLACGCLILAMIIALSLKGRRREFGILLAVGEKKARILWQMLCETLMVVLVAFLISVTVSAFTTQAVCSKMVADQVHSIEKQDSAFMGSLGAIFAVASEFQIPGGMNKYSTAPLTRLTTPITASSVLLFLGCVLLITLVAAVIPAIRILRLSPMTILTKKE